MRVTTAAALTCLLAVTRAHPPGNVWVTDTCFPVPDNTDNECTEKQSQGFDWSGLAAGPFSSYGGLEFSGFTCSVGPGKWNSTEKLIKGKLSGSSGPSISCGQGECDFSISDLYLSTSTKTDVNIVYGMPEGSTCKSVASCSPKKTHITNEQCGGATSVSFQLPDNSEVDGCDLQIHSINFDCSPASAPPTSSGNQTSVSPVTSSSLIHSPSTSFGIIRRSTPAETTSSSRPTETGAKSAPSTSLTHPPSSSEAVGTSTPETTSSSPVLLTTSTVYATKEITITSCAPPVVSCPASSTTVVTTTVPVSTTVGPVTETETLPATPPS
ncbi:extracellular serine-threonine rich protein, partial [Aspergillus sp. HF37]